MLYGLETFEKADCLSPPRKKRCIEVGSTGIICVILFRFCNFFLKVPTLLCAIKLQKHKAQALRSLLTLLLSLILLCQCVVSRAGVNYNYNCNRYSITITIM